MNDYSTDAGMKSHLEGKRQSQRGVWRFSEVAEKRRFFRMPTHGMCFASDPSARLHNGGERVKCMISRWRIAKTYYMLRYVPRLSLLACGLLTITVEGVVARERTVALQENSEDTHIQCNHYHVNEQYPFNLKTHPVVFRCMFMQFIYLCFIHNNTSMSLSFASP